jgi:hypothetical protein
MLIAMPRNVLPIQAFLPKYSKISPQRDSVFSKVIFLPI